MTNSAENRPNGRTVCARAVFIGIAALACTALGTALWTGALAGRFSPVGARQVCSLGFLLVCVGVAGAVWLLSAYTVECFAGEALRRAGREIERSSIWPVGLAVLAAVIFLAYWPALRLSFFGDDFYLLNVLSQGPLRMLLPIGDIYHYFPVTLLLIGIPRWLGIGEASVYHFVNILLHSVNAALVYLIAFRLLQSRFHAFGSAVIFSFFFLSYEPVLWPLVGSHYVVSAFFGLLSFLSFMRYRLSGGKRYLWGFVVLYALSIYTHEIAVPLIGVCIFYDLTHDGGPRPSLSLRRLGSISKAYAVPAAALALLMGIKYFYTLRVIVSRNAALKLVQSFVSAACFLSPFNNMNAYWVFSRWGQNPFFVALAFAVIVLLLGVCFAKVGRELRVMLVWSLLFVLPAILAAELAPRYFYIPAVGWSIFWAGVIRAAGARLAGRPLFGAGTQLPEPRALLGLLVAGLLYGCVALQGYLHASHLVGIWGEGSEIIRETVSSTAELIGRHPDKGEVIVVDQPTWYRGDDFFGAPLLIGSMRLPLAALLKLDRPHVSSVKLHSTNFFDESFPKVSRAELEAAAEKGALVLQYDPREQRMTLYEPAAR
jgi:hypothetical protein